MKQLYTLVLLLFLCAGILDAQNCNCVQNFDMLTRKIEMNYSGYPNKTAGTARDSLNAFTQALRKEALQTPETDTTCWRICNNWLDWFKDKHLYMGIDDPEETPEQIRARYADHRRIELDEAAFIEYLQKGQTDPVEGIWMIDQGKYRVGLKKRTDSSTKFDAIILQADSVYWMPGQVKFELEKTGENTFKAAFYMRNHSLTNTTATLKGNRLEFEELGPWNRTQPDAPWSWPETATPGMPYSIKMLNENTLLFTIPTMNDRYWRDMEQLVKDSSEVLENTPYWIIDVRNNGGGSDITFQPLLKYLYTDPVELDRMQFRATPDNADKFLKLAKDKNMPWLSRVYYKSFGKKLKRKSGEYIGKTEPYTYKNKKVLPSPKHAVVLVNRGCGSSCEQFLLFVKDSKKVTLMGQPSGGVLDYGNLHNLPLPCSNWVIYYPTSRSMRVINGKEVDNIGIPPNIELTSDESEWINTAQESFKKR